MGLTSGNIQVFSEYHCIVHMIIRMTILMRWASPEATFKFSVSTIALYDNKDDNSDEMGLTSGNIQVFSEYHCIVHMIIRMTILMRWASPEATFKFSVSTVEMMTRMTILEQDLKQFPPSSLSIHADKHTYLRLRAPG